MIQMIQAVVIGLIVFAVLGFLLTSAIAIIGIRWIRRVDEQGKG